MIKRAAAAAALAAVLGAPAFAHGPTPQKVEEKVEIKAEPAKVWAVLKNYGALQAWHPGVEKSSGPESGQSAERTFSVKGKPGEIVEGLDEYDEGKMMYGYRLSGEAGEVLPVSSYSAAIAVKPKDGGSEVTWQGRFYRADTSNEPPEGKDDASAVAGMTEFFKTGLEGLKQKVEAGG
ncbi:SRPBCC family protein [Methylopila turkensis]|uniref:MxaD family protein n=1 Tax=Methylopila turkensis TaxID=1437816 RepID=A0A9W6N795_9HYPH|nr:SRPBCC family protein [Methylopila turkensis]GLK80185.1 MxaD family protein [Methylopila turkensis]